VGLTHNGIFDENVAGSRTPSNNIAIAEQGIFFDFLGILIFLDPEFGNPGSFFDSRFSPVQTHQFLDGLGNELTKGLAAGVLGHRRSLQGLIITILVDREVTLKL
jgi:hypothetical protein